MKICSFKLQLKVSKLSKLLSNSLRLQPNILVADFVHEEANCHWLLGGAQLMPPVVAGSELLARNALMSTFNLEKIAQLFHAQI